MSKSKSVKGTTETQRSEKQISEQKNVNQPKKSILKEADGKAAKPQQSEKQTTEEKSENQPKQIQKAKVAKTAKPEQSEKQTTEEKNENQPKKILKAAVAKAAMLKTAIIKEAFPEPKVKRNKLLERESRLLNQMERKLATYQLSCTSVGKGFRKRDKSERIMMTKSMQLKKEQGVPNTQMLMEEDEEKHELAEHLRSIAPFNKRWQVTETINEGTYGVVFAVRDVVTGVDGVIKVAKSVGNDAGNQTAEWEGFVLEKMYKTNPNASIVRLLDKGMLADQNGEGMEFMVLEKAQFAIMDWLSNFKGLERKLAVTRAMLQMLKGIHDMHREGLLHRDLKPDNMGVLSEEQPFVVLFDLGMTRMYTDQDGHCRTPRTTCPFRGTPEWASGWASKGREQSRYDDLVAWMYVACELYDPATSVTQPLPWTYRQSSRVLGYLKTIYCPAYILLRRAPRQFYEINTYLMTANRNVTPRYNFLADKVMEAIEELEGLVGQEKKEEGKTEQNAAEKTKSAFGNAGKTEEKTVKDSESKLEKPVSRSIIRKLEGRASKDSESKLEKPFSRSTRSKLEGGVSKGSGKELSKETKEHLKKPIKERRSKSGENRVNADNKDAEQKQSQVTKKKTGKGADAQPKKDIEKTQNEGIESQLKTGIHVLSKGTEKQPSKDAEKDAFKRSGKDRSNTEKETNISITNLPDVGSRETTGMSNRGAADTDRDKTDTEKGSNIDTERLDKDDKGPESQDNAEKGKGIQKLPATSEYIPL